MQTALERLRLFRASERPQEAASAGHEEDTSLAAPLPGRQSGKLPSPGETAAAHVLALVGAGGPLPHPKIVASLVQSGRTKREAYEAIALLQRDRKIEHDLVTGYVLSSGE